MWKTSIIKPLSCQSLVLVRWLFLRGLGFIHLSAFGSYAFQILALNGSHGVVPTQQMLQAAAAQFGPGCYWLFPTITWLNCSDAFLQGITIAGSLLSLLVIAGVATAPVLSILAVLWLSLVTGGGEFTAFQSDGMLVELTVLSLFFAPWQWFEPPWPVPPSWKRQTAPSGISVWPLRIMLFRIMLVSGLVKMASGDPTWHNLTALQYHFETQPIPTPLAWYFHHLPAWLLKCGVAGMFAGEIFAPITIFIPGWPRLVGACLMFLLHFGIALTGNYTFLNLLMMLLCVLLLSDTVLKPLLPRTLAASIESCIEQRTFARGRQLAFNLAIAFLLMIAGSRMVASLLGAAVLPAPVRYVLLLAEPLHIADGYGLFAVMTTSRPEIVFEGSNDGTNWKSYEFKYKAGDDLKRPPPWVAPHMPRLDWRLWFAAMGPVSDSLWVLGLADRLLEGSPDVQIFFVKNPFPNAAPKYVRAQVYDYHFTDPETRATTGCWWWRDNQRLFLPAMTLRQRKLELAF